MTYNFPFATRKASPMFPEDSIGADNPGPDHPGPDRPGHASPARLRSRLLLPPRGIAIVGALAVLALGTALAWLHAKAFPPCCDVDSYWLIARGYLDHGLFGPHAWLGLRTWAYPAFLALWLQLSEWTGWNPKATLAIVQAIAYAASAAFLARSVPDARLATAAFVLLACNVFVIPYLSIGMADAIALALFQTWLGAALRYQRSGASPPDRRRERRWLALAALCAGSALAVRPAYVWLPFVTLFVIVLAPARPDVPTIATRMLFACLVMIVPLLPQSAINHVHFGTLSPLPTVDLGTMQMNWGKANLKYATALYPGAAAPALFYPNPFHFRADEEPADHPLAWYLEQPGAAAATVAAKFTGMFDFDFLEPYVHHPQPPLQTPVRLLSLAILVLGVAALFANLFALSARRPAWIARSLPVAIFAGWGAVNLIAVPELRFSLPMLSLFLLMIPGLWQALRAQGWRAMLVAGISVACAVVALFSIGELGRAQLVL